MDFALDQVDTLPSTTRAVRERVDLGRPVPDGVPVVHLAGNLLVGTDSRPATRRPVGEITSLDTGKAPPGP